MKKRVHFGAVTFVLILLSTLLLFGSMYAIFRAEEEAKTYHPDDVQPNFLTLESETPVMELEQLLSQTATVTAVEMPHQSYYQTTLLAMHHLSYTEDDHLSWYCDLEFAEKTVRVTKENSRIPASLPTGYVLASQEKQPSGCLITTFAPPKKEAAFESCPLYLSQYPHAASADYPYNDATKIFKVESPSFAGILLEYPRHEGTLRALCFDDGNFYYCLRGIDFTAEELLKIAQSMEIAPSTPSDTKDPPQADLTTAFIPYPVGYTYKYVDTVGKYTLCYDNSDKEADLLSHCHRSRERSGARRSSLPSHRKHRSHRLR